jgi:hypothetical protein
MAEQLELDFGDGPTRITRAAVARWAEDHDVEVLFFDPPEHFDHAILGLVHGFGQEVAIVYDQAKVLAAMARDMAEDAEEWFAFNTIGAFLGEATPRFLIRPWDDGYDVAPTVRPEEETDVEET